MRDFIVTVGPGKVVQTLAEAFQCAGVGRMERGGFDVVGEGVVPHRAEEPTT
ncbi:hypothetical protein [Streptomyces sp. NPDC057889]|uniref:hypothetical protein n=1 Tax=unclassified Streptomyces TaxID=2593676 RepID=UPI0036B5CB9E